MTELEEIENKIDAIRCEIDALSKKLDTVLEKLHMNTEECAKMGNHINFVEGIYDSLKSPLNYICDKVNNYREIDENWMIENKDIENV